MIPRSSMMREITGMLVMAIAMPNAITNAASVDADPRSVWKCSVHTATRPAAKGTAIPTRLIHATACRSERWNNPRISAPALNMRSNSPSWYTASRIVGTAVDDGKTAAWSPGATAPKTVGPSNRPPRISPMTRGWLSRLIA